MGNVHPHGSSHMVLNIARGHPSSILGDVCSNRPVVGINSLRVSAVAIIVDPSSSFSFPITGLIAEVSIRRRCAQFVNQLRVFRVSKQLFLRSRQSWPYQPSLVLPQ